MKVSTPHHILFAILGLVALVLAGCGGNEDLAKSLGCPSGSIMANSDDTVFIQTAEPSGLAFWVGPTMGGIPMTVTEYTVPYSVFAGPIIVEVWEPTGGFRKNNICVVLNSDGFFWDKDYTVLQGSSSVGFSRYVTKTDDSGVATVWWSTGLVLASAVSGTAAGADATYKDTITASSAGAKQAFWNAGYTVKGCAVGAICP